MNGTGDVYSDEQDVENAEMEEFENETSDMNRDENRDTLAPLSNFLPSENQIVDAHIEGAARNENDTLSDTITFGESSANLDDINLDDNADIEDIQLNDTLQDEQVISRSERYRLLMENNRLWRMHRYRPRRKKHVETQSLASRSLHYNVNTESCSALPLKSIDPKKSIQVVEQSLTLMEYCHKKDWENARLRAITHPHEADPPRSLNSRQLSNRFRQQAYDADFGSDSANASNNGAYNFRYDPMLSYSEISTHNTALSIACKEKAPIETIKAITRASPRQLRHTRRSNSVCDGTPLHEVIGNVGDKSDMKVIQFLVQSDEEYEIIAQLKKKELEQEDLKLQHFYDSFHEVKKSTLVTSSQVSSPVDQKVMSEESVEQHQPATPFNFVEEQACPYFSQKSTKRRDSVGRTALHRWIDRVLGLYQMKSALVSLDSDIEHNIDSDMEDANISNTSGEGHIESDKSMETSINENIKYCPVSFKSDEEIQRMKEDSEEIFEITKILVNAYPQASALADRSGKTPLAIALQWEPILLIRYQLERRRRLLRQRRETPSKNAIVEATNGMQTLSSYSNATILNESEIDLTHNFHTQRLIKQMEHRILGIVRIMVEAYPKAVQVKCSSFGCTPLHHAIMHKRNFDTIRVLLETCPESTMIVSNVGELPLHTATSMAAPFKLLKLILDSGPGAASTEDRGGRTPLHWIWIRYIIAASHSAEKSTPASESSTDDDRLSPSYVSSNNVSYSTATVNMFPQNIGPISAKHRRTVPVEWRTMQEAWFSSLKEHMHEKEFRQQMINSSFWKTIEFFLHAVYYASLNNYKQNPFIPVEDIHQRSKETKCNFMVVHAATAASCPRSLLRLALLLYPDAVRKRDENLRLPIHIAASRPINKLWKLDETEPSVMEMLLKASPETAEIVDSENRLPIHLAVDSEKSLSSLKRPKGKYFLGRPIHGNVQTLLSFSPQCLSTKDGKRHGMLCPFMLAGCGENSNLNLTFDLLRQAPEAVHNVMQNSNCVDLRPSSFFDPVPKKQRLP